MTSYPSIIFKVGDAKPVDYQCLTWDAQDNQMVPYDLTNASVYFTMWDMESNVIIDRDGAEIDIAETGWVYYNMSSLYTATADMYRIVFEVEDENGNILMFPEYDVQGFLVLADSYM